MQAFTPTDIMDSEAARFSVAIVSTAVSTEPGGATPALQPVVMMPVPRGLVKYQNVAGLCAGVGYLLARLHQPDHREAVLGFVVVHGVAADDEAVGLGGLVVAAAQHVAQHLAGQGGGEAHYVEGQQRAAAHGVDVAEGVGRGHRAEFIGVVGDGREEVHGQHQPRAVVQPVDGGVVAGGRPNQQVGMVNHGQFA